MACLRAGDRVFQGLRTPTNQSLKILTSVRPLCQRTSLGLTTGTCCVARNIQFTFSLRHSVQLVTGWPHSSPTSSMNFRVWFQLSVLVVAISTHISAPRFSRKKLNTGRSVDNPKHVTMLLHFIFTLRKGCVFRRTHSSNALSNTCSCMFLNLI